MCGNRLSRGGFWDRDRRRDSVHRPARRYEDEATHAVVRGKLHKAECRNDIVRQVGRRIAFRLVWGSRAGEVIDDADSCETPAQPSKVGKIALKRIDARIQ